MSNKSTVAPHGNASVVAPFTKPSWIGTQVFVLLLDALMVYVLVRLLLSKLNSDSLSREPRDSMSYFNKTLRSRMHNTCIVVATMDIVYAASAQIYLILGWNSLILCQTAIYTCITAYGCSILFTFSFLWWRQRVLHSNRCLSHLFTKITQVLSWISIAVISVSILVPILSQLIWRKYELIDQECVLIKSGKESFKTLYVLYLALYCFGILLLMGLFVDPLIRHKVIWNCIILLYIYHCMTNTRVLHDIMGVSKEVFGLALFGYTNQARFRVYIVRSMVLTAVCISGDVLDAIAVPIISDHNRERWMILITHEFHISVNLICMICCFAHWKEILLPYSSQSNRVVDQ